MILYKLASISQRHNGLLFGTFKLIWRQVFVHESLVSSDKLFIEVGEHITFQWSWGLDIRAGAAMSTLEDRELLIQIFDAFKGALLLEYVWILS